GCNTSICNKRSMYSQDLVYCHRQQLWLLPQLPLDGRLYCQVMAQNPDAGSNCTEFPHGPVAQNAHDFLFGQRPPAYPLSQQVRRDVVRRIVSGLASDFQQVFDIAIKFECNGGHGDSVSRQGRFMVLAHPSEERCLQLYWPTEK